MNKKERVREYFLKRNSDPEWRAEKHKKRTEQRRENKRKAVQHMGSKCAVCFQIFPDCCYDFHHKDPTQINDVPSSVLHCSWARILAELEKCMMVCANCHRIIHSKDGYIAHEKRKNLKENYL
jgi:predicted HNH restriction endonuclease